jgi:hypothetical protein
MNSEKETLPNNEVILQAIKELSGKVELVEQNLNAKIDLVEQNLNAKIDLVEQNLNAKIDLVEQNLNAKIDSLQNQMDARFEDNRLQMMSVDVRIDRIEALTHEVLNVAYNARADVKVLREEVYAWSKTVHNLELKVA